MPVMTAEGISRLAIPMLTRTLVLPRTVSMIPGEEFAGSNGDTITVRVPQPGTSRTQASPGATITYDDVNEVPVRVTLRHEYKGVRVTDQMYTLELEDFAQQVTAVQLDAVATGAENWLAIAMNELAPDIDDVTLSNVKNRVLEGRKLLGQSDCPFANRYAACDPEFGAMLLELDVFDRADASGNRDALEEATIGRWRGFTWVESNGLEPGSANLYHRSGFVFANRVPVNPKGAADSAAQTGPGGIGVRQIFHYDPTIASDSSLVSTFVGASVVTDDEAGATHPRVVKLKMDGFDS